MSSTSPTDVHHGLRFIPFPKPKSGLKSCLGLDAARDPNPYCDLTYGNGMLKLVDMENIHAPVLVPPHQDASYSILRDSDLLGEADAPQLVAVPDGWRLWPYYRHTSWEYWRIGSIVHCDDFVAHDPAAHDPWEGSR